MRATNRAWLIPVTIALTALLAGTAAAAKLSQVFPELAERKATLGRTILLVDVVLVDDIAGKVEKVKLGRSWALAQLARDTLRQALADRGFPVDTAIVATIGQGLSPQAPFQSDSIAAKGPEDQEHIIQAPFYVDSLFADPERRALWRKLIGSVWGYERKKNKPPGFLPEPMSLGSQMGYDTVGILYGVSWGVPTTKKFLAALGGGSANSTTSYRFLLADAKTGQVLWSAFEVLAVSADERNVRAMIARVTKDLP